MIKFKNIFIYKILFWFIVLIFFYSRNVNAKFCYKEDYQNFVSDYVGCIAITIHQNGNSSEDLKNKKKLVFFVHGDQLDPKVTYFDNFISNFSSEESILISITRPGWINNKNHKSEGKKNISNGDNYVPQEDVDPIYRVIKKIKRKFNIEQIILIGHSGGAAITGILYGRFQNLIDEAVLISCPCIVPLWRKNFFQKLYTKRNKKICIPKFKSKSPHDYAKKIDSKIKINIYVGDKDQNTFPLYSLEYHSILKENQKNSSLKILPGDHMSILNNSQLIEEVANIIR